MKKIIALLLCLLFVISLCACGETEKTEKTDSKPTTSVSEKEEETEEKEPLVLKESFKYVACAKSNAGITVEQPSDLTKYKIGYLSMCDSQSIVEYYCGKVGTYVYNGANDAFSGLASDVEIIVVPEASANNYIKTRPGEFEIVYGPFEEAQ